MLPVSLSRSLSHEGLILGAHSGSHSLPITPGANPECSQWVPLLPIALERRHQGVGDLRAGPLSCPPQLQRWWGGSGTGGRWTAGLSVSSCTSCECRVRDGVAVGGCGP